MTGSVLLRASAAEPKVTSTAKAAPSASRESDLELYRKMMACEDQECG